jgi:hypothetical protein
MSIFASCRVITQPFIIRPIYWAVKEPIIAKTTHFASVSFQEPSIRANLHAYIRVFPFETKEVSHAPRPTIFFEPMSKRRKGFPSETNVKRGIRVVHGDKELAEKLGRNDHCPCGSGKRFKKCCLKEGRF